MSSRPRWRLAELKVSRARNKQQKTVLREPNRSMAGCETARSATAQPWSGSVEVSTMAPSTQMTASRGECISHDETTGGLWVSVSPLFGPRISFVLPIRKRVGF